MMLDVRRPTPDSWPTLDDDQRARDLVEALPAVVYEMDLQGRLTFVNSAAKRLYGIDDAMLRAGVHVAQYLVPEDRARARENIASVARGGTEGPHEYTTIDCHGQPLPVLIHSIPIEVDGRVVGLRGLMIEIRERKRAEEALAANEERLRKILAGVPDLMFRLTSDGTILDYASTASRAELYRQPEDFLGRAVADVLPPDVAGPALEALREASVSNQIVPFEYRLEMPRGPADYEARMIPVGPNELFVMVRDVTDKKKMDAKMFAADRLAAVGVLAAGIAHEINNPLAYVIINLELALDRVESLTSDLPHSEEHELRAALYDARHGAERIRRIVSDLRRATRTDGEEDGVVDVRTVLDSVVAMTHNQLQHSARIERDDVDTGFVRAAEHRLAQVFLNLLVNAAQALAHGDPQHNRVRTSIRRLGHDRIRVSISDTGSGIPPEHLPRIFDPFFTTKPVGQGTGLGLSICHGIVQDLGGTIQVRSEMGRGTTFEIELPLVTDADPSTVRTPHSAAHPVAATTRGRVMVIDDQPAVLRAVARLLRAHEVVTCDSVRQALERLGEDARFDLLLCDVMMPEHGGQDLYEAVAKRHPELSARMVFMTGGAFSESAQQFLAAVPNEQMAKPFAIAELRELVDRYVAAAGRGWDSPHPD